MLSQAAEEPADLRMWENAKALISQFMDSMPQQHKTLNSPHTHN